MVPFTLLLGVVVLMIAAYIVKHEPTQRPVPFKLPGRQRLHEARIQAAQMNRSRNAAIFAFIAGLLLAGSGVKVLTDSTQTVGRVGANLISRQVPQGQPGQPVEIPTDTTTPPEQQRR